MKNQMYRIVFSTDARKDLQELNRRAPLAVKKLVKLLEELQEHPRIGTGQVEQLKGYDGNVYSRRITHEHRLVYRVYDDVNEIDIKPYICDVGLFLVSTV